MDLQRFADEHDAITRRYRYDDDQSVIAADFGTVGNASVDVVDGTAIVVIETDGGERQAEFDLPEDDAQAFIKNGILTIEVHA